MILKVPENILVVKVTFLFEENSDFSLNKQRLKGLTQRENKCRVFACKYNEWSIKYTGCAISKGQEPHTMG